MRTAWAFIRTLRLHQWIKNLLIFAALIFSRNLSHWEKTSLVIVAFFAFSFLSSSVYIVNDVLDRKRDQAHPNKRHRPIASGALGPAKALIGGAGLLLCAFSLGFWMGTGALFLCIMGAYFLLNLAYSTYLKKMVVADVISIALGFLLRVSAGGLVIGVELSHWLMMCTFFGATMLACCKRRAEFVNMGESNDARAVLADYTLPLLDIFIAISATATLLAYALYTVSERTVEMLKTTDLIYTLPLVMYGICRYLFLVYRRNAGEDPAAVLIKDAGMILAVFLWIVLAFLIVYHAIEFGGLA